jgi:hypothetical protein
MCNSGLNPNRAFECPKSESNKIANAGICEVGPTYGEFWLQKSEICPKHKKWPEVYRSYNGKHGK